MATPHTDVEAMQKEIVRLTQAVETLKKVAPSVRTHRKTSYTSDDDVSQMGRVYNPPPSLLPYGECKQFQNKATKRKEIGARRFSGKESVADYFKQFELTARHNRWDDEDKVTSLLCALDGDARSILAEVDDTDQVTYDDLKRLLMKRFGPTRHPEVHEQALQDLRLTRGQSIRELSAEVNKLTKLAYPDFELPARSRLAVNAMLNAIPDKDVTFYIKDRNPASVEEVCTLYERYKVLTGQSVSHKSATIRGVQHEPKDSSQQIDTALVSSLLKQKDEQQQQLQELTNAVSLLMQTQQAAFTQQPQSYPAAPLPQTSSYPQQQAGTDQAHSFQPRANYRKPPPGPCPRCKQPGHWRNECPARHSENATGPMPAPSNRSRVPPKNL